jgi:hypothetical protein
MYFVAGNPTPKVESAFPRLSQWLNRTLRSIVPDTPKEYLDGMLAEPFEPFTFSPTGAAVYQLGQFGTAAKLLKQFDLKP